MTLEELQNLPYLAAEVAHYDRDISTLEKIYTIKNVPVEMQLKYKAALDDLRQTMIDNRNTRSSELKRLQAFIDNIDDPFLQAIFIEHFENNREWWDVAGELEEEFGPYTADGLKMKVYRYLKKYNKATAADPVAATPSVDNHA